MRTYVKLWSELLLLSWRRLPGLTTSVLAVHLLSVGAVAATALLLSRTVDATIHGSVQVAVVGAVGSALAYTVTAALDNLKVNLTAVALEKIALLELQPTLYGDFARIEGLEHLERTDVLDRITVLRGSSWALMQSMWSAVGTLATLAQLTVLLVLLSTVSPWLLLLLIFAAVPVWSDYRGQRAVRAAETDTAEAYRLQEQLFTISTEAASGKEIRVCGAAGMLAQRQGDAWDEAMGPRFRAQVTAAGWRLAGWVLFTLGFTAGLAMVVYRAARGEGTAGDIVLAITVATSLRQSVHVVVNETTTSARGGRLIEPYLWLRDYVARQSTQHRDPSPTPAALRTGITFEKVSFTYPGTSRRALDEVSFHAPAGSTVAIVGEYGSGKTTIAKLLCAFYRPDAGVIRVDGADMSKSDATVWRARISAAFQDFGRFRTLFGVNVGLGDLPHLDDREQIERAVGEADADSIVARLPNGLDTQLGRMFNGVELSEGQWQKAALARACMRTDPLLFILDEPTASLDAPSEQEIFQRHMRRARELAERTGAVTVIVSHRFSTVTNADQILVLHGGRIVEAGTHHELLDRDGRYAELYNIQAVAYALD